MNEEEIRDRVRLIRSLVTKNLMKDYVPFPMNRKMASSWAATLKVRKGGELVLYTSYMYQMASVFKSYGMLLPRLGSIASSSLLQGLGARIVKPSDEDMERSTRILSNAYQLLKKNGLDVGYLYDEEPYSGAILLEMGFLDELREYGQKLLSYLRERGVKELIVLDPHTLFTLTYLKREAGFDIPFHHYIEVISSSSGQGSFVLHDSCILSRLLDRYSDIRKFIGSSGISLSENELVTGKETGTCCGGPIGSLDSELSEQMAKKRAEELKSVNPRLLVMCPICLSQLSPYAEVNDLLEVIHRWQRG
jgi:Fe-S oxidoreductase